MLQNALREHSAIPLTCIKRLSVLKANCWSFLSGPWLKTGFTVHQLLPRAIKVIKQGRDWKMLHAPAEDCHLQTLHYAVDSYVINERQLYQRICLWSRDLLIGTCDWLLVLGFSIWAPRVTSDPVSGKTYSNHKKLS